MSEAFVPIDNCDHLFLAEIEEVDGNGLRLLLIEGMPAGNPKNVHFRGRTFHDCTPVGVTAENAAFEIVWDFYVAYCVLNESFALPPNNEEIYTGKRFRVYSKSLFREYVARSTFATDEHPGLLEHHEVCCENHVVNVIAISHPRVRQIQTRFGSESQIT